MGQRPLNGARYTEVLRSNDVEVSDVENIKAPDNKTSDNEIFYIKIFHV